MFKLKPKSIIEQYEYKITFDNNDWWDIRIKKKNSTTWDSPNSLLRKLKLDPTYKNTEFRGFEKSEKEAEENLKVFCEYLVKYEHQEILPIDHKENRGDLKEFYIIESL